MEPLKIFMGWDSREAEAAKVARASINAHCPDYIPLDIRELRLNWLIQQEFYKRPTSVRNGKLWDEISQSHMSTEHAISRFLVPYLCDYEGWALYIDCDILLRTDISELFQNYCDNMYAVRCVKHQMMDSLDTKMDGQVQNYYPRKNWSSVILWNCGHKANAELTLDLVNTWPGRTLHHFAWLADDQIGTLPETWNHLIGINEPTPKLVHFTLGLPNMEGYEGSEYTEEWRKYHDQL